jgi:uncharacterized protein (DUF927 family)
MPKESRELVPARRAKQRRSAEQIAAEESKRKREMLARADAIADKVIKAAQEDAALRFLDRDLDADERAVDLGGAYDPIVTERTGQRLSEAIDEAAEKFHETPKVMRRLYLSALKKKWKRERRRITDPTGPRYGAYMVNRQGVWTKQYVSAGDVPYVWRRIARTRIEPVALSRDISSRRNWRTRFLITDETGEFPVDIGSEHLAKDAGQAIVILIKHGARVVESKDARQHLAIFLRYRPKDRIIRAPTTGWFAPRKNKWVFVSPTETLGDTAGVGITLDNVHANDHHGLHRSGTSEQWRRYVAAPLAGNSNVILSVGTFLAAPLLRFADQPGGGFHLHGISKIGKTLAAAVGQSVWGKPYFPGAGSDVFGFTWASTANRLTERAAKRNDLGVYNDESGVGDEHAIAKAIYILAGGLDKGRYGQPEQDFNVLVLSTGEKSLAEFLKRATPGQLVRMVDVPALVQPDSALETIDKSKIDEAGRRFYAATGEYHGSIGYDWLKHLVAMGPAAIKAKLKEHRGPWLALPQVAQIKSRAHPQVVSVINRFCLIAAALILAVEAEIMSWSTDDTDAGIIACMDRWVRQRGNTDAAGELLQEISRRRQTFAATIDDRLIRLARDERGRLVPASTADQNKIDAARVDAVFDGYQKDQRILLTPDAWQRLWVGLDADAVRNHLLRTQLLMPGKEPGRATSPEKVGRGAPERFYVLAAAFASIIS